MDGPDPTVIGLAIAALGALGGGAKMAWGWFTSLVDRFQADSTASRKDFLDSLKSITVRCEETSERIETRRTANELKLYDTLSDLKETLVGIQTVMQERGVPAPQETPR